jgi:hypothetical protein
MKAIDKIVRQGQKENPPEKQSDVDYGTPSQNASNHFHTHLIILPYPLNGAE